MSSPSTPLRYHAEHRTATWLELFFDLIFVVVVAKITHILAHTHHHHLEEGIWWKYPLMLLPVWWIWMGHTIWSNLYDTDSQKHRAMTLFVMLQMVILSTVMITDWEKAYPVFNVAYFAIRVTLAIYFLVHSGTHAANQSFGRQRGTGMIVAAVVSLGSALFPAPLRYAVFYFGLLLDLLHPWVMGRQGKLPRMHFHHLVERMGLVIIILMGESIISLSAGLASIHWSGETILACLSGVIMIGAAWWIYFDSYHHLSSPDCQLKSGLWLTYPHFLTCLGLSVMANVIHHAIHPELDLREYQIMAIAGMVVFYVGKQIPYYAKFPFVRINILVNSAITLTLCVGSLFLPNNASILAGLTVALLFYVVINFLTTIQKMKSRLPATQE